MYVLWQQVRRPDTQQVRVTVTAGPLGLGLSLAEEGSRCVVKGFRPMPDGQPNPGQASSLLVPPPRSRHRRCPPIAGPLPFSPSSPASPPFPSARPPFSRPSSTLTMPPQTSQPAPPRNGGRGAGIGGKKGGGANAPDAIAPSVGFVSAVSRSIRRSLSRRRWVGGCSSRGRDSRDDAYT